MKKTIFYKSTCMLVMAFLPRILFTQSLSSYVPTKHPEARYPDSINYKYENDLSDQLRNDDLGWTYSKSIENAGMNGTIGCMNQASLYLDGIDDFGLFAAPFFYNLNQRDFTIEFYLKPGPIQSQYPGVWGKTGYWTEINVTLYTPGALSFFYATPIGGNQYFGTDTTSWSSNEWDHFAIVGDDALNVLRMYKNGILDSTFPHGTPVWDIPNNDSKIGAVFQGWVSPHIQFLQGNIDDFRVSEGVRYAANFVPPQSLIADDLTVVLLDFETESNGVIPDLSGHSNHLTLMNGAGRDLNDVPYAGGEGGDLQTDVVQYQFEGSITFSLPTPVPNANYQWQIDEGAGFVNVTDSDLFTGAATPNLSISPLAINYNGLAFRCAITLGSCVQFTTTLVLEILFSGCNCDSLEFVTGCMQAEACNYDAAAVCAGPCVYPAAGGSDCAAGGVLCGAGTVWDVASQTCIADPTLLAEAAAEAVAEALDGVCGEGTVWHPTLGVCVPWQSCPDWPYNPDSDADGSITVIDLLALLAIFEDVDSDGDGLFDSTDDCDGVYDACGVCGGVGLDADADGVCDDVDPCVGTLDACGVCNGPGPNVAVLDQIIYATDSLLVPQLGVWYVYEYPIDTLYTYECPQPECSTTSLDTYNVGAPLASFYLNFSGPSSYNAGPRPAGAYALQVSGTFCVGSCWNGHTADAAFGFSSQVTPFSGAFTINEYCPQDYPGCEARRPFPDVYNPAHVYTYYFEHPGGDLVVYGIADECCWWDNQGGLSFQLFECTGN